MKTNIPIKNFFMVNEHVWVINPAYSVCDYSFCKDLSDWLRVERHPLVEGQGEGWGSSSHCTCNSLSEKKNHIFFYATLKTLILYLIKVTQFSHYILVSVKLNVNLMQKIGEKTSLQRETTLLCTNYLPCMMNILPVSPAFSFSSNF